MLPADDRDPSMAEIKPVVSVPEPSRWWMWSAAGAAGAGAVALALFLAAKAKREAERRIIRKPAHEIAMERLTALEARGLPSTLEGVVRFFSESSLILRQYIEDRFALRAPERTSEEFLVEARRSNRLDADQVVVLERYLSLCDQVKFARRPAGEEDARATLGTIRDFVERTRALDATVPVAGPGVHAPIAIELARERGAHVPV